MNERQMKAAVDGIELAISKREVELERLKTKRDAMRWREGASVEIERLTGERNEARVEVDRLTKERDEAKRRADEAEHRGRGWMIEAEDLAERVRELEAQRVNSPYKFDGDSIPASHAEKVLVDVAKAAARLGAEEMRRRAVVLCRDRAMRAGAKKNEHATSGDMDAVRAWFYDQTTSEALASAIGCIDAKEPTP